LDYFDLIIKNGNIITMNTAQPRARWLAIKGGSIAAVGYDDDWPQYAGEIIDLGDKTILPGLSDCHAHVLSAGMYLSSVNLGAARNLSDGLSSIEKKAFERNDDSWIFCVDYLEQLIEEKRFPNRWELDRISNGHKILVFSATMHCCAVNTAALPFGNVPENYPGVFMENNEMTGVFGSDESAILASSNILGSLSDEVLWGYLKDCCDMACRNGVTNIHALVGGLIAGDGDLHLILKRYKELPVNMIPFYQTWNVSRALELGLPRIGGCLTLDGAAFEHTMANYDPYVDAPALRGMLYHTDQEVYEFVSEAHRAGIQCTMHAVGERAIDQLLWTYHRVFHEQGKKDLRHRIEHFCLPTEAQIIMAAELGIIISMQPGFSYLWDSTDNSPFAMVLGRDRADRLDPYNKVIAAGAVVCGGTDSPVTSIEPLVHIAHCVNGDNPIRNITLTDALKMYTINAAYASNMEHAKGSIEVGKDADLTIIDRDPYDHIGKASLFEMKVEYTIVGGKIQYKRS